MVGIVPSRRVRGTPFSALVEAAGAKAFTVYNHMLLASYYESYEADYRHLKEHVQIWDVAVERQVSIKGPDALRLMRQISPRDMDKMAAVAEVEGFDMNNFTPMHCDLASFDSTRKFAANLIEFIKGRPLDRFVCNAAVYQPTLPYAKWSEDNIEQSLQINHLSHFLLCSLFIPIMRDAVKPRVIMVGSVTGNDNTVGGGGVYPIADLHDLKGEKIKISSYIIKVLM